MEIGDRVIVRNDLDTYDQYIEWMQRNAPWCIDKWQDMACPQVDSEYVVIAKAPHGYFDSLMLFAIEGDDGVFVIDEDAVVNRGE